MDMIADYHMHTPLCGHAEGEPRAYVERALALGMREMGFSDHMPLSSFAQPGYAMRREDVEGYVETVLGRRRTLHGLMDYELMLDHKLQAQKRGAKLCWCRACDMSRADERKAVNTRIQGTAADVCAMAMIAIDQEPELKELGYEQVLQVHDEIVGRCPDETKERATELVQWHMEHPGLRLDVPLRAGPHWASSWADAKG